MSNMQYWIYGDIHGRVEYLEFFDSNDCVILLGDAGFNFYCNARDKETKEKANSIGCQIYIVRGNHEFRPQDIDGIKLIYDAEVDGEVYVEDEYPNIHYFLDWGIYTIHGYRCAIIGGAYSVDKYYRLNRHWTWVENEQLDEEEMAKCAEVMNGRDVDFILTHTTATEYVPTELFLSGVDQSTVDTSMEKFLSEIMANMKWRYHCFGHYHEDMYIVPSVELVYMIPRKIDDIAHRWNYYGQQHSFEDFKNCIFYKGAKQND